MKKRIGILFFGIAALSLASACTELFNPMYPYWPSESHGGSGSKAHQTSFFMASDRHEYGKGNNLKALLEVAVEGSQVTPSVVILNGDHVGGGSTPRPEFSVADIYNEIDSVLDLDRTDVILGYGSHDTNCIEGYDVFLSEPMHCDGYYVYSISFAQMKFPTDSAAHATSSSGSGGHRPKDGETPPPKDSTGGRPDPPPDDGSRSYSGLDTLDHRGISAESASRYFSDWVSTLTDKDPIVVMTHMPLHAHRKDNLGATVWMKALKKAARNRDVIVIWAHNHTVERGRKDEDVNTNALTEWGNYLLAPGDSIYVQSPVDSVSVGDVVNFTYVTDGYLTNGYASVVTFSDTRGNGRYDRMRIERFTINATDPFKGAFGSTRWTNPYEVPLKGSQGGRR